MKEHRVFETDDGKRFETEEEALQHEHILAMREKVREFLENQDVNERRSTEYERIILAWESHKINDAQRTELELTVAA